MYLIFRYVNECFEKINRNEYLTLVLLMKARKKKNKNKNEELSIKIKVTKKSILTTSFLR